MEDINHREAKKILNAQVDMIKTKDKMIDILKKENKALHERIKELEK
jgi:hypothetical protein